MKETFPFWFVVILGIFFFLPSRVSAVKCSLGQVMGIKEGTCHDEHGAMYATIKSLSCIPETNITLYVN